MKIVIACDSFKGCLSSAEVARACSAAILAACPDAEIVSVPIADGGEGTLEALSQATGVTGQKCMVAGPLGRPVEASYGITADGSTAIIEIARAAGLALLRAADLKPLEANTYGVGQLIILALARGIRKFIVGLGGSATTDAGMGMMAALGMQFLDVDGNPLSPSGENLLLIDRIDSRGLIKPASEAKFDIICDVRNPLFGPDGAAYVFAPQKGASPADVRRLDLGLRNIASIAGKSTATLPGAGAAGGLGYAFATFLDSRLRRGIDVVLDTIGFDQKISDATLIITGEGHVDDQTLMGKAPMGILSRAKAQHIPVMLIGGKIDNPGEMLRAGFAEALPVTPPEMPLRKALLPDIASTNIYNTIFHAISRYKNAKI